MLWFSQEMHLRREQLKNYQSYLLNKIYRNLYIKNLLSNRLILVLILEHYPVIPMNTPTIFFLVYISTIKIKQDIFGKQH